MDDFAAEQSQPRKELVGKIADLLDRSGLSADDLGAISKVNAWQGFYKDDEGEAHTVDMVGVQLHPTWATGPQWPVVQPANPCVVRHANRKLPTRESPEIRTVLLPDPQIGYRRNLDTGELVPMHDEAAMACALEVIAAVRPHRVVNLGDFLDLAEWSSKFTVLPEFVLTTQPAVNRGHRFLAEQIAAAGPDATVDLLAGNHDDRIPKAIAKNAMAAMRLKRANAPEEWPVLSVPNLLRLGELGVNWHDGYPATRLKIADGHGSQTPLYVKHGEMLDTAKEAKSERQSFAHGHGHLFSMHTTTYEVDGQPQEVQAWSLGCLCRLDGAVPSTKSGTDAHGNPLVRYESWQHGVAVVTETEDGWWLEPVRIHNGVTRWAGRTIRSAA